MIDRVLVPMDDSEMAVRALEYALEAHPDAEITVLHVAGVATPFMGEAVSLALEDDFERAANRRAESVFERARAVAAEHDVEIDTAVAVGKPSREIVSRAADVDAVVMGSHSRGAAERILVGNVAETVVRRSPVPVTVVR